MEPTLFPVLTQQEKEERINKAWHLSGDVPYPKFNPKCCQCGSDEILLKHWQFHKRLGTGSKNPFRCDVSFKCTRCSYVWVHGVPVPKHMFNQVTYHFRDFLRGKIRIC